MARVGSQNLNVLTRQIEIEQNYWYGVLHNNPKISTFPLDYPRDRKNLPYLEGIIRYQIPLEVSRKIISVGNNSEHGIFVILLSSVLFTISQYNDCEDVLVGILPFHPKTTELVSSNILPFKCQLEPTQNYRGFLMSLKNIFLKAEEHKHIPFHKIQELLGILSLDLALLPLVNTIVLYKNIHNTEFIEEIVTDITFSFYRDSDQIELQLQYNQNYYCQTKLAQVVRHCIQFLSIALFNPDIHIAAIDLLTPEEKRTIGNLLNETRNDNDNPETLLKYFERRVKETPQNSAVVFDDKQLTVQELYDQTDGVAFAIQKQGIHPNDRIAIIATNPFEFLIGMLGVLKSGAAFLTISANESLERMEYFIRDSSTKMIICQSELIPKVMSNQQLANLTIINLDECNLYTTEKFQPQYEVNSNDLACLIYGESLPEAPQGVLVEHGSLTNRMNWLEKNNAVNQIIFFLQNTTTSLPMEELLWWSLSGAKIYLLNPDEDNVAKVIIEAVTQNRPVLIHLTPELLDMFNNYLLEQDHDVPLESLKQVFIGGYKALDYNTAHCFYEIFSHRSDLTLFGWYRRLEIIGSEIIVNYVRTLENEITPFGKPLDNTRVYVIDKTDRLQPMGAIGELTVTGNQLARGYLNNPEMTKERFGADLFQRHQKNFKTGERVKWLPDGRIEFLTLIKNPVLSEYEYIAPQNEIEQKLVDIWEEILGIKKIGTHDNFFSLGGNSVSALKFEVLAKQKGLNVTSQDLCYIKILKELALHIENKSIDTSPDKTEKKPAIAKTKDTFKLIDMYHCKKTFYLEYRTYCVLNGIRQILEYYGVENAPLYINSSLSIALTLTKTTKFDYKLGIQPGTPYVLPSHSKYVQEFVAPNEDVYKVWELNKKKIDKGVPLFIALDLFYLDYIPLAFSKKFHSFHVAILCGYSNDEKRVYIADWFDPWFYHGTVEIDQFLKARSSDNPDEGLSRFSGIPIGNYWGEVTPNVWKAKPDEILLETLTISLQQHIERKGPDEGVFYGADAWKKLLEILEENKENGIGYTDGFLKDLRSNLSIFLERLNLFNLYLELAAPKVNLARMPSLLDELHQQINRWEALLNCMLKWSKQNSAESFPTIITKYQDVISMEEKYLEKIVALKNELR